MLPKLLFRFVGQRLLVITYYCVFISSMDFVYEVTFSLSYLVSFQESEQATVTAFLPFDTSFKASRALNSIVSPEVCFSTNVLFGNTISGKCGNSNSFVYL